MPFNNPRIVPDFPVGWRASDNIRGVELVRPFLIVNMATVSDPTQIVPSILALSGIPQLYDQHPAVTYAICTDHRLRAVDHPNAFILDCVYTSVLNSKVGVNPAGIVWQVTESPQISTIQVAQTANGGNSLWGWYQNGQQSATSEPANPDTPWSFTAPRIFCNSSVRVTGAMIGTHWLSSFRSQCAGATGNINSDGWSPIVGASPDPRGTWLFLGATATTVDWGQSYVINLDFLNNKLLWYYIQSYIDPLGFHPQDCATWATVHALGPPAVDQLIQRNGETYASIYPESAFNSIFAF